ncbi:GGDEF and EAL domain-containing protein, partial [Oscillibacter sp.]|uniref:GGDEF and EAL domain-containing protein n=1 Tax=Oscillibacter sp. TaxID=1945593 RepID=UPI0026359A2D
NDRFGHDWGDQYIRQAGQCFSNGVPAKSLCARVSGDEFFLLLSGYDSREEVRNLLGQFSQMVRDSVFSLPNGEMGAIRVSGGVAWYPEDSLDFGELMRQADFAMYQVKRSAKGQLADFDLGVYNRQSFLSQSRQELSRLLEEELVTYHFQPIVNSRTGEVEAYEALMRASLPILNTPDAIVKLAKAEGRLQEVERLTWYRASACYGELLKQGQAKTAALLFVNSIASQCMKPQEVAEFIRRYGYLQSRIVVEMTEAEDMSSAATEAKRTTPGFSGMFVLDDYGSGYNSEKNLLELSPKFIKVDRAIIQNLDEDPDKQRIVSNIVGYAHERDMKIIAEGVETAQEVRKALELGVDLFQGYFLARPAAIPPQISQRGLAVIREFWQEREDPPS